MKDYEEWLRSARKRDGFGLSEHYIRDSLYWASRFPDDIDIPTLNRKVRKMGLQPTTVRTLFNWLKFRGFTDKELFDVYIPPKKAPRYTKQEKSLTFDQMRDLVTKSGDKRFVLIARVAWDTFGRSNEIANIKAEDIDFSNQTILFRKMKGGQSSLKPIHTSTADFVKGYMEERGIKSGFILTDKKGNPMKTHQVRYTVQKEARKILGRHFTTHWFKNSTATDSRSMGAQKEAMKNIGDWKSDAYESYIFEGMENKKRDWEKYKRDLG